MEKNKVSRAKAAKSLSRKNNKKLKKQRKKYAKQTDRGLAVVAIILATVPVIAQAVVDIIDRKRD